MDPEGFDAAMAAGPEPEAVRRDLDLGGVRIHNFALEKDLGADPPAR